ncbi:MAG: hypothetical protein M1562_00175 [Candidatus Marsarchaeota archaeon]|nr:hypothetical protein [Candidatus Marsarchaeota archaeon]
MAYGNRIDAYVYQAMGSGVTGITDIFTLEMLKNEYGRGNWSDSYKN